MTLTALTRLAALRQPSVARDSALVVSLGEQVLESGSLPRNTPETWSVLEQLAAAALDCRRLDLAAVCVKRLDDQFPDSPRVKPLVGMLLEVRGEVGMAKQYYEHELSQDETNTGLKKRLISLHLSSAPSAGLSVVQGLQLLVEHCDSIYVDPESWLLLASTYASLQKHEQSLSALSDLLLLAPQNAFYVLRFAETAYTLEDFELAYRYYLRAVELAGPRGIQASGVGRRAALGIKLCIPKLQGKYLPGSKAPSEHSRSGAPSPQRLEDVDAVVTEALLEGYTGNEEEDEEKEAGPSLKGAVGGAELKALREFLAPSSS